MNGIFQIYLNKAGGVEKGFKNEIGFEFHFTC